MLHHVSTGDTIAAADVDQLVDLLQSGTAGDVLTSPGGGGDAAFAPPAGGGGGGGGTTLLAAVPGPDGATAAGAGAYVAFSTPWETAPLVLADAGDLIIEVQATWQNSADSTAFWAIVRNGALIFTTGSVYDPSGPAYVRSTFFRWVDRALAPGTYTYEVRSGHTDGTTATLKNGVATTPTVGGTGGSLLTVWGAVSA